MSEKNVRTQNTKKVYGF